MIVNVLIWLTISDFCRNTILDGTRSDSEFRRIQWEGTSKSCALEFFLKFSDMFCCFHLPSICTFIGTYAQPAISLSAKPYWIMSIQSLGLFADTGRYMVFGHNYDWNGQRRTSTCRPSPYESSFYNTSRKSTSGNLCSFCYHDEIYVKWFILKFLILLMEWLCFTV